MVKAATQQPTGSFLFSTGRGLQIITPGYDSAAAEKELPRIVAILNRYEMRVEAALENLKTLVKEEHIAEWMTRPVEAFDGRTPQQVIDQGDVGLIDDMVTRLAGGGLPHAA